ncbi:alpha/beta fold hydrolase [Streptomyces sp. NPDC002540]
MSNPGGPGTPGADDALYADDPVSGYSPAMLQRFDVIGFDPRGIGRSRNADCDEAITDQVPPRPRDAAEFERLRTLNGRLAASCLERTGPLAAHMDGESGARDMDAIRAALGEHRISFLGHSYGTFLGERYARLFPSRLRALALDSAMDPDRPNAERYLTDGSITIDDTLKRLAAWCEKDTACALNGKDLTAVTDTLFARADAGTLREPGPNGPTRTAVDADRLADFLTFALGKGSPEETARQLAALYTGKGEVRWSPTGTELASRLVLCQDYDFRIRDYAEYRAIRERVTKAAPHVRYNSQALDIVLGCQGWSMPPKPQPARGRGDLPPVLVVNATHDLATPLPGARRRNIGNHWQQQTPSRPHLSQRYQHPTPLTHPRQKITDTPAHIITAPDDRSTRRRCTHGAAPFACTAITARPLTAGPLSRLCSQTEVYRFPWPSGGPGPEQLGPPLTTGVKGGHGSGSPSARGPEPDAFQAQARTRSGGNEMEGPIGRGT